MSLVSSFANREEGETHVLLNDHLAPIYESPNVYGPHRVPILLPMIEVRPDLVGQFPRDPIYASCTLRVSCVKQRCERRTHPRHDSTRRARPALISSPPPVRRAHVQLYSPPNPPFPQASPLHHISSLSGAERGERTSTWMLVRSTVIVRGLSETTDVVLDVAGFGGEVVGRRLEYEGPVAEYRSCHLGNGVSDCERRAKLDPKPGRARHEGYPTRKLSASSVSFSQKRGQRA